LIYPSILKVDREFWHFMSTHN